MEPVTGRQYKSRKVRPCDFCRKRKVACHMETAPPCQLCRQRQRSCTFALGPGTRTRPTSSSASKQKANRSPISPTPQVGFQSAVHTLSSTDNNESQEQYPTSTSGHGVANTRQQVEPHSSSLVSPNSYNEGSHDLDFTMTQNSEDPFGIFDYDFQNENFETPQSPNWREGRSYTASVTSNRRDAFVQGSPPTTIENTVEIRPNSVETSVDLRDSINQRIRSQSIVEPAEQEDPYNCSLENISGASSRFIGFTGELDLYLLRHRKYDDHNRSTSKYTSVLYQRMQSATSTQTAAPNGRKDEYMPPQVFTIMENMHTDKAEPRLDTTSIDKNKHEFTKLISDEVAVNLVNLYYRFVDPYFPILSRSQYQIKEAIPAIKSMPLSLLAAICATAIPFIIYDDVLCVQLPRVPSVTHLFRISWLAITQELHTPRLSTIQACLLMLQRHATDRYVTDSPFKWTLTSITVAVAQNLGLNRDPSDWDTLAPWERKLRKRLWWAIWVMEKWTALGQGMPTHLHEADCDVDLLTAVDFEGSMDSSSDGADLNLHFYHLMTLTIILSDIVETYYTVKGVRNTANNFQLSLDLAKTARAKLKNWHDKLPTSLRRRSGISGHSERNLGSMSDLDGNGALHLAYIVTQMTLFRALLRPINTLSSPSSGITAGTPSLQFEGALAVVTGALTCIKELVEFIESLTGIDWDAFWHSWSRHNFAIAATFVVQILIIIRASQTRVSSITTPPQLFVSGLLASHQPEPLSPNTTQKARMDVDDQYKQLQELVRRWRWAMRVSARGAGGNKGLMNLSLLRVDALFTEWQTNNTRNEEALPKDVNIN